MWCGLGAEEAQDVGFIYDKNGSIGHRFYYIFNFQYYGFEAYKVHPLLFVAFIVGYLTQLGVP